MEALVTKDMKLIEVGKNLFVEVDDEDVTRVLNYRWYENRTLGREVIQAMVNGKTTSMGRFLLRYTGPLEVDHKDHNYKNCKKENLRPATRQQQMANSLPQGLRVYKGVFVDRKRKLKKKYRASIKVNQEHIHIGYFFTEDEAAKAYDKEAKKHFGEFAYLNFPEEKS
jgi:hypothetical protein